jgi:hypothetical protein
MQIDEYRNDLFDRLDAEAWARGEARGKAESLAIVMGARGIHLTAEQQAVVASCSDIDQLDLWLNRAVGPPRSVTSSRTERRDCLPRITRRHLRVIRRVPSAAAGTPVLALCRLPVRLSRKRSSRVLEGAPVHARLVHDRVLLAGRERREQHVIMKSAGRCCLGRRSAPRWAPGRRPT